MNQLFSVGYIVLSATAFGAMPIFARIAYAAGVTPLTLLFLRFGISAILLQSWMLISKGSYPSRSACYQLIWVGSLGFVLQSICFFTAIRFANPAIVVMLLYVYPTLVAIAERLVWKIPLTDRKKGAIALTTIGAVLIAASGWSAQPLGIALALAAAVVYAGYVLVGSRILQKESPLPSCSIIFSAAGLVFGGLVQIGQEPLPTTLIAWGSAVAVALCSVVAIVSLFAGIKNLGATRAALLSTLEPVISLILVSVIEGILPNNEQLIGGSLIIAAAISLARS